MMSHSPDQSDLGGLVGQLKEFLEFQKNLGWSYLPWSPKNPENRETVPVVIHDSLTALSKAIKECRNCPLVRERRQAVPGQGASKARLMFVGEAPGVEEDLQGQPFVGPAGQLLTKMIQAINLQREVVYITNVVKCRPPENRQPLEDEIKACRDFMEEEIRLVEPEILVALGSCAAQTLIGSKEKISALRGRWLDFHGRRLIATFHPAFLLRNPDAKREAWEDLKKVRRGYDGLE